MTDRYNARRAQGVESRKLGEQSESDLRWQDVMSKAAERWVASYFGASTAIIESNRPDRGYDLVIPHSGLKVDVKWSSTYPGKWYGANPGYPTLNLATWKRGGFNADLYVFTCGESAEDFDRYAWAFGWAALNELLAAPKVQGKYGKPYHALGFDYLHPLDDLLPIYDDVPDEA